MTHDDQEWWETDVPGLHVRTSDGLRGMRLLGWEGVLPLSVVRALMPPPLAAPRKGGDGAACPSPASAGDGATMAGADTGTARERLSRNSWPQL
ncbi:hypothetical protein GCM10010206_62810 [Streptomyces cinerochromogenes]|nr:hypothetical protein GCM10010206_62810 [Streptomyces cinerochromogenes]